MKKSHLVILVIIAAVAFWAGGRYGTKQTNGPHNSSARAILYYTDPMNPGFRSDKPGVAPCGMPLEPVYADVDQGSPLSLPAGAVRIGPERQQLVGIRTVVLEKQPMTYTLRLYGKVVPDETRVYRVNASTDSWIRDLSDVTTGSVVRKNQLLAEALAPSYYNAQVTYLIALDNVDRIKQQMGGQLRHQQSDLANNQIRVAVQALQNLGIGDAQVEELVNTRQARPYLQVRAPAEGVVLRRNISLNQWFKAADEFYTIADIRSVWVYADVYENEARHLGPGMAVRVRNAQIGKTFEARISEVLPLFDPLSRTLKVRLEVENPRLDLRPDMFVDVEIPVTMPPSLHVPADAVADSGTKTIVYVKTGETVFEPRRVDTGWRLGRRIEITTGVMAGEKLVVAGNFLIDSESRMKTAAAGPAGMTGTDPVCGMDVDREEAERAGRIVARDGSTYYFCANECKRAFLEKTEPAPGRRIMTPVSVPGADHDNAGSVRPGNGLQQTVMEAAGSSDGKTSTDPVCGMDVAQETAIYAKYSGTNYFFCSNQCFHAFLKEPGKFAGQPLPATNHDQPPRMGEGTADTFKAVKSGAPAGKTSRKPEAGKKREPDKHSRSGEVIDWKGTESGKTEAADWKGWGKFPGAEYLGLKQKTTNKHDAAEANTGQETPRGISHENSPPVSPGSGGDGRAPAGTEAPGHP